MSRSDARTVPAEPLRLGDYELLAVIARDGPVVLWAALQRSLDRFVTLKFLDGGALPLAEQARRLRREAAAAGRLGQIGTVPVFEVGAWEGLPFLSLPQLDGEPLSVRLHRGPLPTRVAADVLRQLAETLCDTHQRDVLHGNLAPIHVWIDADNRARLTGFGTDEPPDESLSSAGYLAPERARGAPVSPVTDVYGLGALLYAMLTGRSPHQAATVAETLALIRTTPPVPPSRLNRRAAGDLETICLRCLRHDREGSYGAGRAMVRLLADLRRFLGGRPVSGKRRRTGRELLAAARHLLAPALLLLVVIGLALWDGYRDAAAWQAIARPEEPSGALRYFERRYADAPESSETTTALALALYRADRLEEAARLIQWKDTGAGNLTWHGDRTGWRRTQMLTLALIALRQGRNEEARRLEQQSAAADRDTPARPDLDEVLRDEVRSAFQ